MAEMVPAVLKHDPGTRVIHRNGIRYVVIALANMQQPPKEDYPPTVVYMDVAAGHIYTRPLSRWTESSFTLENPT